MKTLLLIVFALCAVAVNAQTAANHLVYVKAGISPVNYFGGGISLNYIYKHKYAVQLGYSSLMRDAASTPGDYHDGVIGGITFGSLYPSDQLDSWELLIGRVKVLNQKGTIRLNLKGGLAFSRYESPHNWEYVGETILAPNYAFDYQQKNTVGVILKPELELPLTRIFGLSVLPFLLVNPETTAVGAELNLMLGILRARTE